MASYSSRGPTRYDRLIKPDLVAPGNRIRGLLAPEATLARDYPELVIGSGPDAHLQLSGTSMAAAVVSGAAALMVENSRRASPLAVRVALQYSAERAAGEPLTVGGAGRLHIFAALAMLRREPTAIIGDEEHVPSRIAHVGIGGISRRLGAQPVHGDQIIWSDQIVWSDPDYLE